MLPEPSRLEEIGLAKPNFSCGLYCNKKCFFKYNTLISKRKLKTFHNGEETLWLRT